MFLSTSQTFSDDSILITRSPGFYFESKENESFHGQRQFFKLVIRCYAQKTFVNMWTCRFSKKTSRSWVCLDHKLLRWRRNFSSWRNFKESQLKTLTQQIFFFWIVNCFSLLLYQHFTITNWLMVMICCRILASCRCSNERWSQWTANF